MKRGFNPAYIQWRFYLLISMIVIIVLGLVVRVVDLTFFKQDFLRKQGNERVLRVITIPAFRGMITDRMGHPLAISTPVYSVWANPKEFTQMPDQLGLLSQAINIPLKTIKASIQQYQKKGREFVYLKRSINPELAEQIKKLKIPGIYLQAGFKRFYPEGEVAAHVVGSTNIDDKGQEGLELAYNQWLSGVPGKALVVKDPLGRIISKLKNLQTQAPGNDLVLSIDHRIQYLAYRELMAGVEEYKAESGSAVVIDTETGEILAMVNQPSYNPNALGKQKPENLRNRAVTDVFEPGSTIKAFSVAASLDSGLYKADTVIDTYPGWLLVGRKLVRDEHKKGPMTVREILQFSSNVGVTKMILSLPSDQSLWKLLNVVGMGESTGVGFPGERSGVLVKRDVWKPFTLATLAFGYGLSVTTLQLAQAYMVIANEGVKKPLSLLKVAKPPEGKLVMNPKTAKAMIDLLESVTAKGGTAEAARIPGYRVAGKTGTVHKVGVGGYEKNHYMSSFVGMAPATHPRLVIVVILNDPQGKKYYGGLISAPIFKNIMEGSLRILNVKPDDVASL